MGKTPDRFPGALEEDDEILFTTDSAQPTTLGSMKFVDNRFRMKDTIGVFNPRSRLDFVLFDTDGQLIYDTLEQIVLESDD